MDPRISFSNDFVDAQQAITHENIYREAPVSSDFEFSVKNYSMIPADEVFFQGMLLPLKKKMTIRDELLANDDDYEKVLPRIPKSSSRWKERLGLRKGASKKDKNKSSDEFLQRVADGKMPTFEQGVTTVSKDSQELFYEGGVSYRGGRVAATPGLRTNSQLLMLDIYLHSFWNSSSYNPRIRNLMIEF